MSHSHQGFTLAELLIALALLGIIAAFTIPKLIQTQGQNEAIAKVREAVATLEQSWYDLKQLKRIQTGRSLYDNIRGRLNTIDGNAGSVAVAGSPYSGLVHPCDSGPWASGWIQFGNGVVISGLTSGPVMALSAPPDVPPSVRNYTICIDSNGKGNPNILGTDVFLGNFNQWGNFDGSGATFFVSTDGKNFYWGSDKAADSLYNANPTVAITPPALNAVNARVGTILTK